MAVIYIDVLFSVNFIIDMILLWCTAKTLGVKINKTRLFLGGFFGGVYSAAIFFPQLQNLQLFIIKIAASAAMIAISFKFIRWRQFFKTMAVFYGVNILFGGGLYVFMTFFKGTALLSNGSIYFDLPFAKLILLTLLIASTFYISLYFVKKSLVRGGGVCKITAEILGNRIHFYGFIDTGNSLKEPASGAPVIVLERAYIKNFIDEVSFSMLENCDVSLICALFGNAAAFIPYNSVGCENGVMIGIKAKCVKIEQEKLPPLYADCFIGICNEKLKTAAGCHAIINPDIFRKGNYNEVA